MAKYVKKPIVVDAVKWNGGNFTELLECFGDECLEHIFRAGVCGVYIRGSLVIVTKEGDMITNEGAYIVRGVQGEYYQVDEEIFNLTYDSVSPESAGVYLKGAELLNCEAVE